MPKNTWSIGSPDLHMLLQLNSSERMFISLFFYPSPGCYWLQYGRSWISQEGMRGKKWSYVFCWCYQPLGRKEEEEEKEGEANFNIYLKLKCGTLFFLFKRTSKLSCQLKNYQRPELTVLQKMSGCDSQLCLRRSQCEIMGPMSWT